MMKNTAALLPRLYQTVFFMIENLSKQILVIKTEMLCGQVLDSLGFLLLIFYCTVMCSESLCLLW